MAAGRVLPAHPGLTDEEAAQVEPAAVAFHGVRRSRVAPGDTVVVQGAGPIGLLSAQFARAAGAGQVVVVEPAEGRRRLAREVGVDVAVAPGAEADEQVRALTRGLGADVVDRVRRRPGACCRRRSTWPGPPAPSPCSATSRSRRPSTLAAGWPRRSTCGARCAFTHDDVVRAMAFMADGRVRTAPLHTRTIGLGALPGDARGAGAGRSDDVKVLVDPRRALVTAGRSARAGSPW